MKYDPSAHWQDKIARVDELIARRRARLAPPEPVVLSPATQEAIAEVDRRASTHVSVLLEEPTRDGSGETQGERLVSKARDRRAYAAIVRAVHDNNPTPKPAAAPPRVARLFRWKGAVARRQGAG